MKRIAITGACGQISYSLLFRLINGDLFGKNEKIKLHLLDLPQFEEVLEAIEMELKDCASHVLDEVIIGSNPFKVFEGVNYAFLVGAKPRGPGMERNELLHENGKIFSLHGKALNETADKNVKVLVVGNPCNTNCLIAQKSAPSINPLNFHAMMRLDENRAKALLAEKSGFEVSKITDMTIWGNHSVTQVPDFYNAKIDGKDVLSVIKDEEWLKNEFIKSVQQRGASIIAKRGKSSAASAACAAVDAMKSLHFPTKPDNFYSTAYLSDGNSYGIADQLVFSFPSRTLEDGSIEIVKNLDWNEFLRQKIILTQNELKEERDLIKELL
jgi:malate dehydrogenase